MMAVRSPGFAGGLVMIEEGGVMAVLEHPAVVEVRLWDGRVVWLWEGGDEHGREWSVERES